MSKENMGVIVGLSEEAKEFAKKQAKLEGKPMGRWVSDCILGKGGNKLENQDDQLHLINVNLKSILHEINEIQSGMRSIYTEIRQEKHGTIKHRFFGKFSR